MHLSRHAKTFFTTRIVADVRWTSYKDFLLALQYVNTKDLIGTTVTVKLTLPLRGNPVYHEAW